MLMCFFLVPVVIKSFYVYLNSKNTIVQSFALNERLNVK